MRVCVRLKVLAIIRLLLFVPLLTGCLMQLLMEMSTVFFPAILELKHR